MDYGKSSISELIRGPLVRTPQGLVFLSFSLGYLLCGLAFLWAGMQPPLPFRNRDVAATCCFVWPFMLFILFLKGGLADSFVPSWTRAAWQAVYAMMPVAYILWGGG